MHASLYDLSPLAQMLVTGFLLGSGPLLLVYLRNRRAAPLGMLHALALVTLFLTFDLVMFGAFTRLTDSGLGCPDWPGCYGEASPLGASVEIAAAHAAMPTGPVTPVKAWIEMVHRYLAMGVGLLITVLAVAAWVERKKSRVALPAPNPWWSTLTWVWVCVQGAFGALTVTMKLFPAIVSLHLLGGYILLALITVQTLHLARSAGGQPPLGVNPRVRRWILPAVGLLMLQSASGAWVSTNYAVLACTEFPKCQGGWWPLMDFSSGFTLWRPLGLDTAGGHISFQALTAIHFTHRLLAVVTLTLLSALAWTLRHQTRIRKPVCWLAALLTLQLATGLSNVVLGWPIAAAVVHTGGAGAMVVVLVWLFLATCASETTAAPLLVTKGKKP